jgi:hypothetical protein
MIELLYECAKFDILYGSDHGVPDDKCVYIGKEIASISDDDYQLTNVIHDIEKIEDEYSELQDIKRDGLSNGPLKLVMGARMC